MLYFISLYVELIIVYNLIRIFQQLLIAIYIIIDTMSIKDISIILYAVSFIFGAWSSFVYINYHIQKQKMKMVEQILLDK